MWVYGLLAQHSVPLRTYLFLFVGLTLAVLELMFLALLVLYTSKEKLNLRLFVLLYSESERGERGGGYRIHVAGVARKSNEYMHRLKVRERTT